MQVGISFSMHDELLVMQMSGLNSAMEDLSSDDEDEPYTRPPRRHATRTRRDHAAVAGDTQPPPDAGPSLAGPPTAAADEPGDLSHLSGLDVNCKNLLYTQ